MLIEGPNMEVDYPSGDSNRRWVILENEVRLSADLMRGNDTGAKMLAASRIQTLAEDLHMALEREDEGDE